MDGEIDFLHGVSNALPARAEPPAPPDIADAPRFDDYLADARDVADAADASADRNARLDNARQDARDRRRDIASDRQPETQNHAARAGRADRVSSQEKQDSSVEPADEPDQTATARPASADASEAKTNDIEKAAPTIVITPQAAGQAQPPAPQPALHLLAQLGAHPTAQAAQNSGGEEQENALPPTAASAPGAPLVPNNLQSAATPTQKPSPVKTGAPNQAGPSAQSGANGEEAAAAQSDQTETGFSALLPAAQTNAPKQQSADKPNADAALSAATARAPDPSNPRAHLQAPDRQTAPDSALKPAATPSAPQTDNKPAAAALDNSAAPNPGKSLSAPQTPPPMSGAFSAAASATIQGATTQGATAQAATTSLDSARAAAHALPAQDQIGREIVRRFTGETTRFEMRLDPPDLGRVDVRLEVSRDHRVTAVIAADSPQALSELTRHARELTEALQSSGLDLADNGLSFDLAERHGASQREFESGAATRGVAQNPDNETTPSSRGPIRLESWRGARIDLVA